MTVMRVGNGIAVVNRISRDPELDNYSTDMQRTLSDGDTR